MSRTYNLACPATKQYIWVGQGWDSMTTFYSGDPEVMLRLGRFLEVTRGKSLELMDSEVMHNTLDYVEFEVAGTASGCKKLLAPGQYWGFCGETDMGQGLPALCVECGGEYKLKE